MQNLAKNGQPRVIQKRWCQDHQAMAFIPSPHNKGFLIHGTSKWFFFSAFLHASLHQETTVVRKPKAHIWDSINDVIILLDRLDDRPQDVITPACLFATLSSRSMRGGTVHPSFLSISVPPVVAAYHQACLADSKIILNWYYRRSENQEDPLVFCGTSCCAWIWHARNTLAANFTPKLLQSFSLNACFEL